MKPGSYTNGNQEEQTGQHIGAPISAAPDMIVYTALREEVSAGDLAGVQTVVETHLLASPAEARCAFQSFMFHIHGYDEDPRELYNIPDCRAWFQRIDRTYPFLIYFLPCAQYTLYVGSQQHLDGTKLSVDALWSFFRARDGALHELAQRIEQPYDAMKEQLLRTVQKYAQIALLPW